MPMKLPLSWSHLLALICWTTDTMQLVLYNPNWIYLLQQLSSPWQWACLHHPNQFLRTIVSQPIAGSMTTTMSLMTPSPSACPWLHDKQQCHPLHICPTYGIIQHNTLVPWINNKANPWIHHVSSFTILHYNTLAPCQNNKAIWLHYYLWFHYNLMTPYQVSSLKHTTLTPWNKTNMTICLHLLWLHLMAICLHSVWFQSTTLVHQTYWMANWIHWIVSSLYPIMYDKVYTNKHQATSSNKRNQLLNEQTDNTHMHLNLCYQQIDI